MATAEVTPPLTVDSVEMLQSGSAAFLQAPKHKDVVTKNLVLPPQERTFPASNVPFKVISDAASPNARPARILFGALRDPKLYVKKGIPLDVTVEESTVIVCWADIDEFGTGATLSSAIDDFGASLRELYHHLFSPDANLGSDLQKVKEIVGQYIKPRK